MPSTSIPCASCGKNITFQGNNYINGVSLSGSKSKKDDTTWSFTFNVKKKGKSSKPITYVLGNSGGAIFLHRSCGILDSGCAIESKNMMKEPTKLSVYK